MTNPIHTALDEEFRGSRVRVVANDGAEFTGYVDRIHHHDRHVMLRSATRHQDGEDIDVGSVYAAHCDVIEHVDATETIEHVPLADIVDAPYHCREFDVSENTGYINQVREREFVGSYPVVRPYDSGYQVVEGHKRLWVARQAGLETHPVEIVHCSDWELAKRFVWDHLPVIDKLHADGTAPGGYYDVADATEALDALLIEWQGRILELERVKALVDELDIGITGVTPDVE